MISWLEATLPFNPYCIDGFFTGDSYLYSWANTKAEKTETDDDTYFVHRGKLDIFNFSRKPEGKNERILNNFKQALNFRNDNLDLITKGDFTELKTGNDKVFAYSRRLEKEQIIVVGNLDFKNPQNRITIKDKNVNQKKSLEVITGNDNIKVNHRKLLTDLEAGEIKVLMIKERK